MTKLPTRLRVAFEFACVRDLYTLTVLRKPEVGRGIPSQKEGRCLGCDPPVSDVRQVD